MPSSGASGGARRHPAQPAAAESGLADPATAGRRHPTGTLALDGPGQVVLAGQGPAPRHPGSGPVALARRRRSAACSRTRAPRASAGSGPRSSAAPIGSGPFRALEVATLFARRRAVRNGSVWLERSLSFRGRDCLLLPSGRCQAEAPASGICLASPALFTVQRSQKTTETSRGCKLSRTSARDSGRPYARPQRILTLWRIFRLGRSRSTLPRP